MLLSVGCYGISGLVSATLNCLASIVLSDLIFILLKFGSAVMFVCSFLGVFAFVYMCVVLLL